MTDDQDQTDCSGCRFHRDSPGEWCLEEYPWWDDFEYIEFFYLVENWCCNSYRYIFQYLDRVSVQSRSYHIVILLVSYFLLKCNY